ncbi:MAG: DNA topoisomerase I [Candidatus Diapherotrites archaeon]
MDLVIAEKPIAGKRIAELLAGGKVKEESHHGAVFYSFEKDGRSMFVFPLKGHIKDVDFPKHFAPWLGTDLSKLTNAEVLYAEKEKGIISLLKSRAPDFKRVIFATDSDREGESIALEALVCLKETNKGIEIKRANFSAITAEEINQAFSELGELDYNFADSADARREIDLIWGAVLTRFLSLVSGQLGKEFLSAGRVQSPTLALIVDREKEILAFKATAYWELQATFEKGKEKFLAFHKAGRFWEKEKAESAFAKKADYGTVLKVTKSEKKIAKPLPFNTTTFLRAATAIGFSAAGAMSVAETLYQRGLISYPRTDNTVFPPSINLRKILEQLMRVEPFYKIVEELLAKKSLVPSRGASATKDHPPIHPVDFPKEKLSEQEWKIYELVCRRFFAVLGDDALVENLSVDIDLAGEPYVARGQLYIELGWKKFYPYSKASEVILPKLEQGDKVKLIELEFLAKETKPPARYSQGTLIKTMAELGLGTKSTRHETIQKLYYRHYIHGAKAIEPNKIAFAVIDSLEKFDGVIVKPKMTSELEKEMDEIAAGKKGKKLVVDDSREMLLEALKELLKNKNEIGMALRLALRADSHKFPCTREGCTGMLVVRTGKTGKRFLGCTSYPACTTIFPLPQKGSITAMDKKCEHCGHPMIMVKNGRYSFKMCIYPGCKSKEEWRARNEKKEQSK